MRKIRGIIKDYKKHVGGGIPRRVVNMKKYIVLLAIFICNSILFAYTKAELMELPNKQTAFYGGTFSRELLDKVRVLEGNPADFIASYDECDSYTNHALTAYEKNLFLAYFRYLPEKIQTCLLDSVYAIYFVDGMQYGGFTDFIFDENRKMYCVLYLNGSTFHTDLNTWLEYRDNSLFTRTDELNKIKVQCSDAYQAFLHVLTHEAMHVYDYINGITPYMDSFDNQKKTDSAFYRYWKDKNHPLAHYDNKLLSRCSFYFFGKQTALKDAKKLIEYLAAAPFSTWYGAKNFQDDFAETATFYFFKKQFSLNYKIEYISNGKVKAAYSLEENPHVRVWDSLYQDITGL